VLANKNNKKLMLGMPDFAFSVEASPMATNDPIPLFLSDLTEEPEQAGILKAWDGAVIASRILKIGILIVTAAAIVFAVLSMTSGQPHRSRRPASAAWLLIWLRRRIGNPTGARFFVNAACLPVTPR
jgi:hypothetical protein